MDFDDHRAPRSDVCILLLHHNIGDALVLCVSCVQSVCASSSTSNQNVHWVCVCHS